MVGAEPVSANVAEHQLFEVRGIEPVPPSTRYGSPASQFRIWFGADAVVSSLFVGMLGPLVFGLSFWSSFTAILVGTAIGGLAIGFGSTLGPRTGMVMILFSRFTFGYWPGRVLGFLNAIYCYAWSAVNLVTGTAAVQLAFVLMGVTLLGTGHGSYVLWVLVIAAITTTISVLGYNLVHFWENWSTVLSIIVFAVLTVALLLHHPTAGTTTAHGVDFWKNWIGMVLTSFGFAVGWVPYVSDYSRKLPQTVSYNAVFAYAFLGLTISTVWVEAVGALITAMSFKTVNGTGSVVNGIPAILHNNGFVVAGLLIIGLSTVSNNIPNDYTGGLSMQAAGIHVQRWIVTLVGGLVSALGAIFFLQNFADKFEAFLLMVSYWVGAWFVLVIYNFVKRGGRYNAADWDRESALPTGIGPTVAFIAALIGAWIGMYPQPAVDWNKLGQGLLGTHVGVDLGFILAIIVALVIRVILDVLLSSGAQRSTAGS